MIRRIRSICVNSGISIKILCKESNRDVLTYNLSSIAKVNSLVLLSMIMDI